MSIHVLTLETVAPIHIGAGGPELRRDIDFAAVAGQIYMLDTAAVLNAILPEDERDLQYQTILKSSNLASFLNAELLADPALYSYKIKGDSKLQNLRPITKNAFGRPYIPGSSLKGALRTAWLRHLVEQSRYEITVNELNDRREWAFQTEEARMLSPKAPTRGAVPNYSHFRAIQISDSQPFDADAIRLYNAVVFPAGPKGIPIDLEGIKPRIITTARLKLDDFILQTHAATFGVGGMRLETLLDAWKHQGEERLRQEVVFWTGRPGGQQVLKVYQDMQQAAAAAPANIFYIETGWGTGWNSKTMGKAIKHATLERILTLYRNLSRSANPSADNFPKTRRAAVDSTELPRVPFGWLKVTVD